MRRLETVKPTRPAFGLAPRPVAPSSRISPPDPVAAPGKRRDRGRVVVRLDLHQRVRELVAPRRTSGLRADGSARPSRLPSRLRCPNTRRPCRPDARVRRADHREQAVVPAATPSTIQSALKILCRQCSEFACANIMSSTSVGSRPRRRKLCVEIVDLVGRQRETQLGVRAFERSASFASSGSSSAAAAGSARRASRRRANRRTPSRSSGRGSAAATRRESPLRAARRRASRRDRRTPRSIRAHRVESAVARDVGRLRRPGRDRARPRHDEEVRARRGRLARRLRTVGQQLVERGALVRTERSRDLRRNARYVAVMPATRWTE